MRQVPSYTIIGSGRMAKHFCRYFELLQIPYVQWSRQTDPQKLHLAEAVAAGERVLLLINDIAIEPFILENSCLKNKCLVHCSGSLATQLAYGAHPLFTFSHDLYDLATYQAIPFILEENQKAFTELFPQLKNPHFTIPAELKPFYHAMSVVAGNFTCMLWQEVFQRVENKLHIPKEVLYPYVQQVLANTLQNPSSALTGPLVRKDHTTIAANLKALDNDPLQKLYQAFAEVYQTNRGK